MKCIVWLGNPGKIYENTRHNVGFFMIDLFREQGAFSEWTPSKHKGMIAEGVFLGEKTLLLKPETYMNLSGESVTSLLHFYKIASESDLLVISDDLDMDFAKIRYREKGSHGGQNGLRSIIKELGHADFSRLKIGIGRDSRYEVSDWVLSRFTPEEQAILRVDVASQVMEKIQSWYQK